MAKVKAEPVVEDLELDVDDLELDLEDKEELDLEDDEEENIQEETAEQPEPVVEEPPKRRRGRPKGSKNKPKDESAAQAVVEEAPKKRRGRPPGSKNKASVVAPQAQGVDPTDRASIFRAALDLYVKDVRKQGGDVSQLERVRQLADLLL